MSVSHFVLSRSASRFSPPICGGSVQAVIPVQLALIIFHFPIPDLGGPLLLLSTF